jgi:hypothetical protein
MPYSLSTLPGQSEHLLVALRRGALLLIRDAGERWLQLPVQLDDVIALGVAGA